ncbi:MAG: M48 family metallopeptidase [Terriglobia bacterium]
MRIPEQLSLLPGLETEGFSVPPPLGRPLQEEIPLSVPVPHQPVQAEPARPAAGELETIEFVKAEAPRPHPDPSPVFARVFQRLGFNRPLPEFRVSYFPYAGLRSKIRLRGNVIEAGISDLLLDARPLVLEALAEILLCKLFRRRPSHEARDCYLAFARHADTTRRIEQVRRQRGNKVIRPPWGFFFNLQEIFDDLNRRFFQGEIRVQLLGWSAVRSRTVLGHYDSAHSSITISRWLDSARTPRYLVEYVVFHEMLHVVYPVGSNGHRRVVHSAEFRAAERRFPQYEQARRKLKQLSAGLG